MPFTEFYLTVLFCFAGYVITMCLLFFIVYFGVLNAIRKAKSDKVRTPLA